MAEIAAAYAAETVAEGAAVGAYTVAKGTMPLRGRWKPLMADVELPRSSHSMCVIDGQAFIFGGEVQPRVPVESHVHVLTLPSGMHSSMDYNVLKAQNAPPPRIGHSAVSIGRWMYVFGGRGGTDMKPLEENGKVWCFDTRDRHWVALEPNVGSPIPQARSYHCSAAMSTKPPAVMSSGRDFVSAATEPAGTIFIHGGCPASGRLADVWGFDLVSKVWKRFPDAPGPPRGGAALACSSERLFRFGGFDGLSQLGGQMDFLHFGAQEAADQHGFLDADPTEHPLSSEWQSIRFDRADRKYPQGRSVAGMHHVSVGQGRNYLVLLLGERNPSDKGHDGAGEFWEDVWSFQLKPDNMTAASVKDSTRQLIGIKTSEYDWDEVLVPEATKSEARAATPGRRGWFASSAQGDLGKSSICLWGGINEDNERLSDGYILTLDL